MPDILLRVLVLAVCFLGIWMFVQVAWWTLDPWTRLLYSAKSQPPVAIEAIGFLESGKIQKLHGEPTARALSHRLQRINATLSKNLTREYAEVQKALKWSLPEAPAIGGAQFVPVVSQPINFEAKIFNLDVIGIGTFFHDQLYKGDVVRSLLEVLPTGKVRYFVEIERPDQIGDKRLSRADRTIDGDVHNALNEVAMEVAHNYHGDSSIFAGLSQPGFRELVRAFEEFQDFIVDAAGASRQDKPYVPERLKKVIANLESGSFAAARSSYLYSLRASLYKLDGNLTKAIDLLEKARELSPLDPFVVANLDKWRSEVKATSPQVASARAPDAASLEAVYKDIRSQPGLAPIKFPEFVQLALGKSKQKLVVAVLSTGYSPGAEPLGEAAEVLPTVSMVPGETGLDRNGHGTWIVNLLAALIPYKQVQVLPIKVLGDAGSGADSTILAGLNEAVDRRAGVILLPLGRRDSSGDKIYQTVIDRVVESGILIVAAAGNDSRRPDMIGKVQFPAALKGTIAVGSTDRNGGFALFTPDPTGVDVHVTGVDIITVDATGQKKTLNGSSFSSTIAAAVLSTISSARPGLSLDQVRVALKVSSALIVADGPPVLDVAKLWAELVDKSPTTPAAPKQQ